MHFRSLARALAAAAVLTLPAVASAQTATTPQLPTGKWTGTITPQGSETAPVTYDVKISHDTVTIVIDAGEHGSFPTSDVVYADGQLSFSFTPGPKIACVVTKVEEDLYVGECVEGPGRSGRITMVPPKAPAAASK